MIIIAEWGKSYKQLAVNGVSFRHSQNMLIVFLLLLLVVFAIRFGICKVHSLPQYTQLYELHMDQCVGGGSLQTI